MSAAAREPEANVRVIVYGAGATGAPLGAFLHEAGIEPLLITRGKHLEVIQQEGLTVVTAEGRQTIQVPAVSYPSEVTFRAGDIVFMLMKAPDHEEALRGLRASSIDPLLTPIFCGSSAIACEDMTLRYFARVYGAATFVNGVYLEPGIVYAAV